MLPGHDLHRLFRLIEALIIVHNIMFEFGDDAEALPHFLAGEFDRVEEQEAAAGAPPVPSSRRALLMGMHRRKVLLDLMN